ncbi:ATP-binding protein [Pseudoalteromonas sp. SG41-1]|uniref:ATP-binding protein n=1 Tax=Pseudoalteromonas sp. SG41-1 TaxID=2760979 RepID=UPI0015FFC777|nr:ATP-binding protein [Pseudoalteromonas sp. SG41-1]MBB1507535.1 ATP-binding protein [Pseudoalteromonas sp. SG41-1]
MSIATKITTALSILFSNIKRELNYDLEDYCFLETASDKYTFVARDGSFVSVYEVKGIKELAQSNDKQYQLAEDLYKKLKSSFKEKGHSIQFFFSRDPERTQQKLEDLIKPFKYEAKNLQMDADFLFENKINNLLSHTVYEESYLVVWSRPTLIQESIKEEKEKINEDLKTESPRSKSQAVDFHYETLENKHNSFCSVLENAFKATKIAIEKLDIDIAGNRIKSSVNSDLVDYTWKPKLPNKKIVQRDNETDLTIPENDISYLLHSPLAKELIPCDIEKVNSDTVKLEDKYIASMFVETPQDDKTGFQELLSTIDKETPFQISFKIDGGGLNNIGLKKFLSAIFAWVPMSNNRLIKESIESYESLANEGSHSVVKTGISLNTWAYDLKTLNKNKQKLSKLIQSWGSQTVRFTNDDPYEGLFNSIPAFTPSISGNNFLDTLDNVLFNLPLTRQANIWDQGCIINRSLDGKIMPYEVASSKQSSWGEVIFAKPGSGKSVWSNYSNFSFCLQPKTSKLARGKLPLIGIIDIGKSSSGLIRLLHSLLPKERHGEAVYHMLSNSVEDAINVFDTQLGCRKPNNLEKQFIVAFISHLVVPFGTDQEKSTISKMVANVVDDAYKKFKDQNQPKVYEEYKDELIDREIAKLQETKNAFKPKDRSWWWIVDKFFAIGNYKMAKRAQRYAVPKLDDLVKIVYSNSSLNSTYSKPKFDSGENYIEYFIRNINENIKRYPMINEPTLLDFEEARVISLDLNDVAPEGDAQAKEQSGMFYMLARYITTKKFTLREDTLKCGAPSQYKNYLIRLVKECQATPKRFVVDELHRTSGLDNFKRSVIQLVREGRKWKTSICLISQLVEDFDDKLLDMCNSKFIMSGGDNYEKICSKFDLPKTVEDIVRTDLNGATSEGVPFIAKFTTKKGDFIQHLFNTLSPMERWAFSSTAEDETIRTLCEEAFGGEKALKILAESIPSGSVVDKIEQLQNSKHGKDIIEPIEYLFEKLKKKYNKDLIIA